MPTLRHIILEDLHLAQSPQGLLNLFGQLGYTVERDVIPLDKNDIGFAPADSAAIKRLFLLADEGGQVQVTLFELDEAALTRIRSLVWNLLKVRSAGESAQAALDGELNWRVYGLFGVSDEKIGVIKGMKDEKEK